MDSCLPELAVGEILFSTETEMMVGSPQKTLSLFKLLSRVWHSLQSGMYMSSPPIIFYESLLAVLKVKLAFSLQSLQIAVNFLIFSHFGKSDRMFGKTPLRKVP